MLLYYREATDGQILEEGITEAGSMSSFIAAGTSYATHGIDMIPFFIFYSMFGFHASATSSGRRRTNAPAASCWVPRQAARRSTARVCSTRTAIAICWRASCPTCWLSIRPTPSKSR